MPHSLFAVTPLDCTIRCYDDARHTHSLLAVCHSSATPLDCTIRCYATPTDVLAALELPAVTNVRVSFDYCYGNSWDVGASSLLPAALGKAPSKDPLLR